jgi:hypothetical protein
VDGYKIPVRLARTVDEMTGRRHAIEYEIDGFRQDMRRDITRLIRSCPMAEYKCLGSAVSCIGIVLIGIALLIE